MIARTPTETLSIRLLRAGRTPATAIRDTQRPKLEEKRWSLTQGGQLFVGQLYSNEPEWKRLLAFGSADLPEMSTSGAAGVLFLPIDGRTLAICFGQAHVALDPDAFERQFGLRVTLNVVPRKGLRTVDTATVDSVTFQRRTQASKESDVDDFGIDKRRDLARVAGGKPAKASFGKFVAGRDTLSLTCEVTPATLEAKCKEVLKAYASKEYKKEFDWIDNLARVYEKDVVGKLDALLLTQINALRAGTAADLHLSPPEIVDYVSGGSVHYNGLGQPAIEFQQLEVADYVSELDRAGFAGGIEEIKEHRVSAQHLPGSKFDQGWKVYDCFVAEASIPTGVHAGAYVLFAGDWFKINRDFKKKVEQAFSELVTTPFLASTTSKNEKEFLKELEPRADMVMLDQTKINPNGTRYANIEVCDFLTADQNFIHLKDGTSSGPISHLWMQGVVSAEAFMSDKKFRQDLRKRVKARKPGFERHLSSSAAEPTRRAHKCIYGIMRPRNAAKKLDLPFFSKVSLQTAAERVASFGLTVEVHLIEKL